MKRVLAVIAAVALACVGGALAATSGPSHSVTFADGLGESATAADLQTIVISSVGGQYTFDLTFKTPLAGDDEVFVFLDTDRNRSTGEPSSYGSEYLFVHYEHDHTYDLLRWDGSSWAQTPTTTMSATRVSDSELRFSVNRAELGNSPDFNFWVDSWDGVKDGASGRDDVAPELGTWEYKLPLELTIASDHETAASAGHRWTLSLVIDRSDTGGTLGAEATIGCHGTGSGRALQVAQKAFTSSGSGSANTAECVFSVPKSLKRKLVHGTITVSYQGLSVTHTFTARAK